MKNITQVFVSMALSVGLLGCNNAQQNETVNTEAENTTVTEQPIEEKSSLPEDAPVINVAITGQDEPFGFKDEYGNVQGIDVDVIKAVGETQGFRTEFTTETRESLLPSIAEGKHDVAMAFLSASPERVSKYSVTKPYFFAPNAILYKDDALNIKSIDDLTGLNVGVVGGASHESYLRSRDDIGIANLEGESSPFLLYQGLVNGKHDAIVYDKTILQYTMNSHKDTSQGIKIAPYEKVINPRDAETVMIVAKGNKELVDKLNAGIDTIQENGEMDAIIKKWLGDEATNPLQD